MAPSVHRTVYIWLALCALALSSWLCAESPLVVGILAVAKFAGIFWVFMEMNHAHRAWLALALAYLAIWFSALLLI